MSLKLSSGHSKFLNAFHFDSIRITESGIIMIIRNNREFSCLMLIPIWDIAENHEKSWSVIFVKKNPRSFESKFEECHFRFLFHFKIDHVLIFWDAPLFYVRIFWNASFFLYDSEKRKNGAFQKNRAQKKWGISKN